MFKDDYDMLKNAETIMANATLRDALVALKQFKETCLEANYSQDEANQIGNFIAVMLFTSRFNIRFGSQQEENP